MSGIFGVATKGDCFKDLFYGTDYQSHLGTQNAGMAVYNGSGINSRIHSLKRDTFRAHFEDCHEVLKGNLGIGIISDYEPQPLVRNSHLGDYAISHVGIVRNLDELIVEGHKKRIPFADMSTGKVNPTEIIASLLLNQEDNIVKGLEAVQEKVVGSSSLVILTSEGIYLSRDKFGRTPLVVGGKDRAMAVASENCAFFNLGYENLKFLGPGEIGLLTPDGYERLKEPNKDMSICSFLWVYFGDPASSYEDIRVETVRERCGAALARRDMAEGLEVDFVAGVPDSGISHAIGYASEIGVPYRRAFRKYTATWQRSFMPQVQEKRELVAEMKLAPIPEIIKGNRLVLNEDSIVRGTQLRARLLDLFTHGAREVHIRPSCPPLIMSCNHLNFSRSRSELDLAARRAIERLEGVKDIQDVNLSCYSNPDSDKYEQMVEGIKTELISDPNTKELMFDPARVSLRYQRLDDLSEAIGLPLEKLCTYCWDGKE